MESDKSCFTFLSHGATLVGICLSLYQSGSFRLICSCIRVHLTSSRIKKLIGELGVTGGDDRKIGYYAGLIVRVHNLFTQIFHTHLFIGLPLFCYTGTNYMALESVV